MLMQTFPKDSGPIYLETLQGRFPVEPFNTYSNLIFLAIIIYWGIKVYQNPKQHVYLAWVIPIIAISFVGGTVYHATRSHEFWLRLDWMPIMFLVASLVIYFVFKLVSAWWKRLVFIVGLLSISFALRVLPMPSGLRISLGYAISAGTILVPILLYLKKTRWENVHLITSSFGIFGVAIAFRIMDKLQDLFPMGTHWLWHFFGGIAVHFLIAYIFRDNLLNLSANSDIEHD
jgi:hemolysin III